MAITVVDVADIQFSNRPDDILEVPSLGACIGLWLYDPTINTGGVVVYILPDSSEIQSRKTEALPYMFADTAILYFLEAAIEKGIRPERSKRVIVGGGQVLGQTGNLDLGARNGRAALDTLAKLGLPPTHQSIGGVVNRTASLHIKTGMVHISAAGEEIEQL